MFKIWLYYIFLNLNREKLQQQIKQQVRKKAFIKNTIVIATGRTENEIMNGKKVDHFISNFSLLCVLKEVQMSEAAT